MAGLSYTLPSTDHQIINRNPVINSNMSSGEESNACVSKETNRTQCPICRSTYGNTSTSWQIIGGQSPRDHTRQISGIVLRMISRTGRPSDPFSEVDDNGSNDEVFVLTDTQNSLTENL
ncbi:unnamed protein product [Heterobilharzia americana]|nr:unnamed protein product [Heterobilharzia americana]